MTSPFKIDRTRYVSQNYLGRSEKVSENKNIVPAICVYATGRSGSNFLKSHLNTYGTYCWNEMFTYSDQHNRVQLMSVLANLRLQNAIPDDEFAKFLELWMECEKAKHHRPFEKANALSADFFRRVKETVPDLYGAKRFLVGYMHWYDTMYNLNIQDFFPDFDSFIYLYRLNTLKQWISFQKVHITNQWIAYEEDSKAVTASRKAKIHWKRKDFVIWARYMNGCKKKMYENYLAYPGNKCILNYEQISSAKDSALEIKTALEAAGIKELPVSGTFITKQQSDPNMKIEDNFANPEEFLKDYEELVDKPIVNFDPVKG